MRDLIKKIEDENLRKVLETLVDRVEKLERPTTIHFAKVKPSAIIPTKRTEDAGYDYGIIHPKADAIIIQAYAEFTVNDRAYEHFKYNKLDYAKNPIINKVDGSEVAHEEARKFSVSSKDWLQAILDIYGIDTFLCMANFFDKYNMSDLHSGNIGYIIKNGIEYPVVLDWMSNIWGLDPLSCSSGEIGRTHEI